jgi:hypothetical protein
MLFEILSTLCAALFAGAAIYINLVEYPARVDCGVEFAPRAIEERQCCKED